MDEKTRRFLREACFIFLWWTSFLISGFVYWNDLTRLHSSSFCTSSNVLDFLALISNPKYWLAILTTALTIIGGYQLYKKLASARSYLDDFRYIILILIIMLILLIPVLGCR